MKDVARRFWSHVQKTKRCWLWRGTVESKGYGSFGFYGGGRRRRSLAHRVSWELTRGLIPEDLSVLHRCDVRNCVRPCHLFLGTQKDNVHDAMKKGRHSHGEKHGMSKLTKREVWEIRSHYWVGGCDRQQIARHYNITPENVSLIVNRRTWR